MTQKTKRHIIASVGTALVMFLLFLLLWFVYLTAYVPEEEEGVEIAFGEVEEAGGYMAEQLEAMPLPAPEPAAPVQPASPAEEEMLTSEEQEALALDEAKKAEKKAKETEAIAKANQFGSLFGQSGNTTGSGDSQGNGQKGNPIGHGSVGGNSWSLAGRGIKGTLPTPSNNFKQEGKVVVQIRVNAAGQVIDARETTGGTISDKQTVQLALEAARKAKFTEGDHDQIGTITFIFKLN